MGKTKDLKEFIDSIADEYETFKYLRDGQTAWLRGFFGLYIDGSYNTMYRATGIKLVHFLRDIMIEKVKQFNKHKNALHLIQAMRWNLCDFLHIEYELQIGTVNRVLFSYERPLPLYILIIDTLKEYADDENISSEVKAMLLDTVKYVSENKGQFDYIDRRKSRKTNQV